MPLELIMGIHLHQPVGNFPEVLEHSFQKAYRPFIEIFREFPSLKLVWHCTGYLLQWLEETHPDYLAVLADLVRQDRLEILSGGLYEPIFPVIPPRDRFNHIQRLSALLEEKFACRPQGVWLAERVWEPGITADLAHAGIQYVSLDDSHFFAAGVSPRQIDGYFMVEELDQQVGVFPISEKMRYLMPWAETGKVLEEFQSMEARGVRLTVMMDDAEKFGSWPGTHDWVYGRGWWRDFCQMLEKNQALVRTTTFRQYFADNRPHGRAALPAASYAEMGQWALPPDEAMQYDELKARFEQNGMMPQVKPFFRGGIWRNFLVRYPESNYLHKRMLHLSAQFDSPAAASLPAYDLLLRSQCNDVFWHGVFGGLYLPHLRQAAFRNLLEAQTGLESHLGKRFDDGPEITWHDLDLDRADEILVNHRDYLGVIAPAQGGSLLEWSYKPIAYNLLATLARWPEKYHLAALSRKVVPVGATVPEQAGANTDLIFDRVPRTSCREKLYRYLPDSHELRENRDKADYSFWDLPFHPGPADKNQILLRSDGDLFSLEKRFTVFPDETTWKVDLSLSLPEQYAGWLAVEWTLGIAGGDDPEKCCYPWMDRLAARGLGQPGHFDEVEGFTVEDRRDGFIIDFVCSGKVAVRHWPVETVSLAIDSMEKTYQGLAFCLLFPVRGNPSSIWFSARVRQSR